MGHVGVCKRPPVTSSTNWPLATGVIFLIDDEREARGRGVRRHGCVFGHHDDVRARPKRLAAEHRGDLSEIPVAVLHKHLSPTRAGACGRAAVIVDRHWHGLLREIAVEVPRFDSDEVTTVINGASVPKAVRALHGACPRAVVPSMAPLARKRGSLAAGGGFVRDAEGFGGWARFR